LENLITRLVGTVEGQNENIAEASTVQATLLARIARIEERGAAGAAPAAPAPAAPVGVTALEARLIALEKKAVAADKAAKTAAKDVDLDDELDYVPYYEGRGLKRASGGAPSAPQLATTIASSSTTLAPTSHRQRLTTVSGWCGPII
jgi:hypothetical protein